MQLRKMYALWFEEGYLCHVNGDVLATDDVDQASLYFSKEEATAEGKVALKDGFVIVPIDVTIIKEPTNGD